MSTQVFSPFPLFATRIGAPLTLGSLYIGEPNEDPETMPKEVFWDEELTIPAFQPLRTDGGYILNGGNPSAIYTDGDFSVRVRDRNGAQIFYRASVPDPEAGLRNLSSLLSSTDSNKGSGQVAFSATAVYPPSSVGRRLQQVITPQDHPFLAYGDGLHDDTNALTAWINALNTIASITPGPIGAFLPSGIFKYTAALPAIRQSITVFSDNARQGVLAPAGNFDCLTFQGGGNRVPDCGLAHVRIDGANMTGGYGLVVDWTQDFTSTDVLISDAWNGIKCRQSGNPSFNGTLDKLRGTVGFQAVGYGGQKAGVVQPFRNGEMDKIDVLSLDLTIGGLYAPGDATATLDACIIDGFVHTILMEELRMLSCRSGLSTVNTAGLDEKYRPALIRGWIEAENTLFEGVRFESAVDVLTTAMFASSSGSRSGIRIGSNVRGLTAQSATARSNASHGIIVENGATDVVLYDPLCILNDSAAAGIRDETADGIHIYSGRCGGGELGTPETQSVGVSGTAATRVYGTNVLGNVTAGVAGGVFTRDCKGAVPNTTNTQAVSPSPWAYTTGSTSESISISGGAVSTVTVNGTILHTSSNVSLAVPANSSVLVAYTTAPTIRTMRV